jgi:hypothetical protein
MTDTQFLTRPHDWGLGIPLGWTPSASPSASTDVVGHVFFRDQIVSLDALAYTLWTAALLGDVDFARCGDPDYSPPGVARLHSSTGTLYSPAQIAAAAQRVQDTGLLWHFDPMETSGYQAAEHMEVAVQGIPLGNVDRADRYRIAHNDGSPALDLEGVAYLVWLQWWSEPAVGKAARAVADELGLRRVDVVGQAVRTLTAGMRTGLLYIARTHNP